MPLTRSCFIRLLNDAHNEVNARLGKRTYTIEEHNHLFAPRAEVPNVYPLEIFLVVLLVILLLRLRCNAVRP